MVSPSRFSPRLDLEQEDGEFEQKDEDDMNKEEDEIEEGELVEKRGVPSKVSTVKGRRQNVGLVNKSKRP